MGTEAKEQVNRGAQNSPTSTLDAMLPGEAAHSTGSLQDYDVQKAVGKGGYSVVYKGTRKKDDRVVAIKKIEIFDMAPKKRERCLQEVQLLQTCKHPNIIQMLDAFIDDNQLIIVFEWAPAGDLKRLIKKTAEAGKMLEESLIWNYFFQIADAVRYMHKNRVMHRDIKPANVLVGANGALKLGDLGLGRHFSESTHEVFSKVGTPYYVSPEVVKGIGYDWKSDVWSMGCLLYELAVLKSPFETEGANLYDVFQKINAGDYAPLPTDRHSEVLQDLVERMLQTDPAQRPEMEEVWRITRSVFDHQHHQSRSTHLMSEQAADKLLFLAAELRRQTEARKMIGSDADGIASDLVAPPAHILRSIHPLVFAESDGVRKPGKGRGSGKASRSSGAQGLEGSSYQFALMLCIVAWLLQLNGRTREAEDLEKEFSLVSGSSLKAPPRKDCSVDDASRISIGNRIRAVVQSLGMEVDFATSQGIASGCGRTVCMLLDGLAQKTITLLQIRAKKPVHPPNPDFSPDGYQEILEDLELPEEQLVCLGASAHDEEPSSHSRLRSSPSMLRSAEGDASRCMIESGVDPAAWQAEAERLAGQLSRISVKAETSGRFGAWEARLIKARKATETFLSAGPEVQAGVSEWRKELNKHLDALENREAHINREWSNHTLEYSAARQRMADVIQRRDRAEEVVSESTSHLAHLTEQLQQIQEAIDERQSNFDGARPMARMKEAMAVLKREIADMGQKVEIARGHLLLKQKRIAEEMRGVRTS